MNSERYYEVDFSEYLEKLVSSGKLNSMQTGIIKLVIDKNLSVLSEKQRHVFDKAIEENYIDCCNRCLVDIAWCEMDDAFDNGGYCSYCNHQIDSSLKD